MNILKTILISFLVSAVSIIGFYYYLPFEINELNGGEEMLGTTITTIAGSDTLKNSRTTINNNFAALNSGKIEVSTTTLLNITTLGTLTTGTWNADTLTVAYGGTGSTTLLSNAVLLGNGTGMLKAVPASDDGKVLMLTGGVPAWGDGTIDQTLNYNWTGKHSWTTGTTTFNSQATFNGQTYLNDVYIASGTLNEYPNASSSLVSKGYNDKTRYYIASDNALGVSSAAEETDDSETYVLEKQVRVFRPGIVRVKFDLKSGVANNNVFGRIYINNIAVGTERSQQSASYTTYSEDVYVSSGDRIQLYVKQGGSETVYTRNFIIYADLILTDVLGLSDN